MIQYSNATYIERTAVVVTRQDLVNLITQALSDAGWTTISGTPGSGSDVTLETAAGNQGQKIRVRANDPGSGSCMNLRLIGASGSPTGTAGFCFPNSLPWRVIANKFSFYAFSSGNANRIVARYMAHGGTLYVPSFLSLSAGDSVGILHCTGSGDGDVSSRTSWRATLRSSDGNPTGRFNLIWQSSMHDASALSTQNGALSLGIFQSGYHTLDQGWRWHDDAPFAYEPLVAWGITTSADEAKLRGQLYDAMIVGGRYASEFLLEYDGRNWRAITDSASASVSATATLFVVIP